MNYSINKNDHFILKYNIRFATFTYSPIEFKRRQHYISSQSVFVLNKLYYKW